MAGYHVWVKMKELQYLLAFKKLEKQGIVVETVSFLNMFRSDVHTVAASN